MTGHWRTRGILITNPDFNGATAKRDSPMSTVQLELEDDLVALLQQNNQPLQQAAKELIVLELYRRGTLSSGKAAELFGMPRWEFVRYAADLGIPYFEKREDEWEAERANSWGRRLREFVPEFLREHPVLSRVASTA